jgi:hypothetical protein
MDSREGINGERDGWMDGERVMDEWREGERGGEREFGRQV